MSSVDRARKNLIFGGQALDPNAVGGPDLLLAHRLLRDAALDAARVLAGSDAASLDPKVDALGAKEDPTRADVEALEAEARKLVMLAAEKEGRPGRLRRWAVRLGLILPILALAVTLRAVVPDWTGYSWKASSALDGWPRSGRLNSESRGNNVLFHTKKEDKPWVEIDLRQKRAVEEVVVQSRLDCCKKRGLPLQLERKEGDEWIKVARRDMPYVRWAPEFEPFEARYIRLRATAKPAILSLSDIQVR